MLDLVAVGLFARFCWCQACLVASSFADRLVLRVERPFNCGAACFCPLEMTVFRGGTNEVLGKTVEDFDPYCSRSVFCICAFQIAQCTHGHVDHIMDEA